ncbi:MAG: ATP-dependent DNA helicase RecG [Phycisphaerales bacterium JB063]
MPPNPDTPKAAPESASRVSPGSPVTLLPGVGPARAGALARLGIHTLADLLRHQPMRYEKLDAEGRISDLPVFEDIVATARGTLSAVRWVPAQGRGKKGRFQATLQDDSGTLALVWFHASYLRETLHAGQPLRVQGKVKRFDGYPQMTNPKWEKLKEEDDAPAQGDRLRPVYPSTEGLPSHAIEKLIGEALDRVLPTMSDPLPTTLTQAHNLLPLADAFEKLHRPAEPDDHKEARRRLAYNELLLLQLGIAMKRAYVAKRQAAPALTHSDAIDRRIRERFPFELTPSQDKVIAEVAADLTSDTPMNRLVQGDVGSGKTVIALYAMLLAVSGRKQAAIMAPTELLAEQHYRSICELLVNSDVEVRLLTGGASAAGSKARQSLLAEVADGSADIVVGTQALVTDAVVFKDLGVAVVDEQHRFGVMQRARLRSAGETTPDGRLRVPHHLVMTATPIPRTLSLTIFGDLDVSTITGKPPGRVPIENRVVAEFQTDTVYEYLSTRLELGEQAYVVVPAIDGPGDDDGSGGTALKSVAEHAKLLREKLGGAYEVAEVHGRLSRDEREQVMQRFRAGKSHVLVATTVIEVGVDVPNATVMVIEHAERFGLAQLHQLRGRIGRGASVRPPLCVFVAEPSTDEAIDRINAIASTNDGFKIAEEDLRIRGMGEFFGTKQSGMPPLRVADIPGDLDLLQLARLDAKRLIETDWLLKQPAHSLLRRVLLHQYGESLGLIDVG